MQEILDYTFWGNTVLKYLIFLLCFAAGIVVIKIIKRVALKRLTRWAQKTKTQVDDILVRGIRKYLVPLFYFGAFYLSALVLTLNDKVSGIINVVTTGFMMVFGAVFLSEVVMFLLGKYWEKKKGKSDKQVVKWLGSIVRAIIWIIALLLFLTNIGVDITPLMASLGVGGIAIAFALQAILEDLFSFVSIFFDRPFEIGDFIIVGDMIGTVEHIGIKTTRLRSISGEQLVFSNKDLTGSRIKNYKRMDNRRALFTIGVTYSTPLEKLKEIPCIIQSVIESTPETKFDRSHFSNYSAYSLDFETAYYVLSQDFNFFMDTQQEVFLKIYEEFNKRGIDFAFPTQTLHVEK